LLAFPFPRVSSTYRTLWIQKTGDIPVFSRFTHQPQISFLLIVIVSYSRPIYMAPVSLVLFFPSRYFFCLYSATLKRRKGHCLPLSLKSFLSGPLITCSCKSSSFCPPLGHSGSPPFSSSENNLPVQVYFSATTFPSMTYFGCFYYFLGPPGSCFFLKTAISIILYFFDFPFY